MPFEFSIKNHAVINVLPSGYLMLTYVKSFRSQPRTPRGEQKVSDIRGVYVVAPPGSRTSRSIR